MRRRTAKKVLARFNAVGWGARRDLVVQAHRKMGLEVPPRPPPPVRPTVADPDPVTVPSAAPAIQDGATSSSSVAELRAEAKARGLSGYSKMKKADLVTLLG